MATYALVCLVFMSSAVLIGRLYRIKKWRAALAAFIIVALLTLHFEPLMIHLGLYHHDLNKTLGITVRNSIPIEDFLYVLFAAIIVPGLWDKLGKK